MSNTNLDIFFDSHNNITIISDYEGEDINSKIYDNVSKKGLIICGDMLDSTVSKGYEEEFNKLTGKINDIQKIYNLRNILAIVENKNIHLIFGNRDINKFKCKFLTRLNENETNKKYPLIRAFNNGDINLSFEIYNQLKESLKNIQNTQNIWKADTKHWHPFWNITQSNIDTNDIYIFLKRFYTIFGYMNANNILYTIPIELGITLDDKKINNSDYLDYLAFIVLAVFRTMTLISKNPKIEISDITIIQTTNTLKDTILNGLLNKLYSNLPNTSFVSYFNRKNMLYIFSHGGISSTLINNNNMSELKVDLSNNYNSLINMTGGGLNMLNLPSGTIISNLEKINNIYMDILKKSYIKPLKYDYKPNLDMLLSLSTSASYKPNSDMKFILNSPITPGIDNIERNIFYCSDKNIVQIFGHQPKGFSTSISKFIDGDKKTYLINLDSSQSYKYTSISGKSDSFLSFENNIPILRSTIDITKIKNTKYTTDIIPDTTNTNTYITNGNISGNILKLEKKIFDSDFINYDEYIPTTPDYKYHGLFSNNNQEYYVFSILNETNKVLLVLKKENKSAKDKYYKYKLKYLKLKMSLNNQN
jgi:hypothetical protein